MLDLPAAVVIGSCEPPCHECLEMYLGPLPEQHPLLTTQPFLQSLENLSFVCFLLLLFWFGFKPRHTHAPRS